VIISAILTRDPMRKMGRAVIPLSLRDIYRDPGLGFEIMLERPCLARFTVVGSIFTLAHA